MAGNLSHMTVNFFRFRFIRLFKKASTIIDFKTSSGRALMAAPVWVLSYINRLFGGTDLSKCVLFQYFLFPSILCSILCGQLCILLLCVFRLVQFILWSHLSSHCHHPLYAGGTVSLWALELQARPPLLPEATRSFLPRNQRSRHRRVAYTSRL
jgi:hypothetical protein